MTWYHTHDIRWFNSDPTVNRDMLLWMIFVCTAVMHGGMSRQIAAVIINIGYKYNNIELAIALL